MYIYINKNETLHRILLDPVNSKYLDARHFDEFVKSFNLKKHHESIVLLFNRMRELEIRPNRIYFEKLLKTAPTEKHVENLSLTIINNQTDLPIYINRTIENELARRGMTHQLLEVIETLRKRKGNLKKELFEYNLLLKSMLISNQTFLLGKILNEMEEDKIRPDEVTIGTIITIFSRKKEFNLAFTFVEYMNENFGIKADFNKPYKLLIDKLIEENQIETVITFLNTIPIKSKIRLSQIFHLCIKKLLDSNYIQEASKILDIANTKEIYEIKIYTEFVCYYLKKNDFPKINIIYHTIKENENIRFDIYFYTILMQCFLTNGDYDHFLFLVNKIIDNDHVDLILDEKVYLLIISYYLSILDVDSLLEIVRNDKKSSPQTIYFVYNKIINYLCSHDQINAAYQILEEIEMKKLPIKTDIYKSLFDFYCRLNDTKNISKLFDKIKAMESDKNSNEICVDFYSIIASKNLHSIDSTIQLMEEIRIFPNFSFFNTITKEFHNKKKLNSSIYLNLLEKMGKYNILPPSSWYEFILLSFCKNNLLDDCLLVIKHMDSKQFSISNKIYSSILKKLLALRGNKDLILYIRDRIVNNDHSFTLQIYNLLILALVKRNLINESLSFFHFLTEQKNIVHILLFKTFVRSLVLQGEYKLAFDYIKKLNQFNLSPDYSFFTDIYPILNDNFTYKSEIKTLLENFGLNFVVLESQLASQPENSSLKDLID